MDKCDDPRVVQVDRTLLVDCEELLVVLTKNAAHCYGVDFGKLNTCLMDLAKINKPV